MADESRLSDLLTQWQEQHAQGRDVAVNELCRDCPELPPNSPGGSRSCARGTSPKRPTSRVRRTAFFESGTGRRPETAWHVGPEAKDAPTHSVADTLRGQLQWLRAARQTAGRGIARSDFSAPADSGMSGWPATPPRPRRGAQGVAGRPRR